MHLQRGMNAVGVAENEISATKEDSIKTGFCQWYDSLFFG
jgi:hypothetical protein